MKYLSNTDVAATEIYDYLFVTHLPAFYKVNLYKEIAKKCRILVIFIASSSTIRTADFTPADFPFPYVILNHEHFEKRPKLTSCWRLFSLVQQLKFNKLVVGGWDLIEFWLLVLFYHRGKNMLALESSIHESRIKGLHKWLKRIFLARISTVFASGSPHEALLQALAFKREIKKTYGVGIFNYHAPNKIIKSFRGKFIYVGRLACEKNLSLLLKVFQRLPQFTLTIIGQGPLQNLIVQEKSPNVTLIEHVPNQNIGYWYQQHDAFILPSFAEPWGLVIEEALFYGLPVLASQQVGCAQDLVVAPRVGVLFDPTQSESLTDAILTMKAQYNYFVKKVAQLDFRTRDAYQIDQYVAGL